MLFHELPEAQVTLLTKGVHKQVKVFRRDGSTSLYAQHGSGFIKLGGYSGTSVPTISWDYITEHAEIVRSDDKRAPQWRSAAAPHLTVVPLKS